jgi:N-succinyldiaminopimelate aminotransferase
LRPDWSAISEAEWKRVRLMFVCSPSNPHGRVMTLDDWKRVFELSDRHGFVVVSDECYSEIYFDEARAPLGALAAAKKLGRDAYPRLVVLGSLSKRSSAPGLRSGYAAGDAAVLEKYLQYRTYFGSAMSNAVQMASIAAWKDESHVIESRRMYREKFAAFYERVNPVLPLVMPDAAFYFWANVGGDDASSLATSSPRRISPCFRQYRARSARRPGPRFRAHGFILHGRGCRGPRNACIDPRAARRSHAQGD